MSMLQPFELEVFTKNGEFDDHELAKMPAERVTRLANNYTENYRILRTHYLDLVGLYKKLQHDTNQKRDQGLQEGFHAQEESQAGEKGPLDIADESIDFMGDMLDALEDGSNTVDERLTPDQYKELQEKERTDDNALLALAPLGQLAHIHKNATAMFSDQPRLEDKIEKLRRVITGEGVEEREKERAEGVRKAKEATLEEGQTHGEGEKGMWWEDD